MSEHLSNILASYDESSPSNHPSTGKSPSISPTSPSSPKSPSSGQWWCYNDSTVTPITSDRDIVSSSAYVLFYIRKDIQYSRFQDIHSIPASIMEVVNQQRSLTPETPMSSSDQEEKSARTLIGESMNEAKNTLTKLIPPSIATSRATVDSPTHQNSDPSTSAQSDNQETCTLS